MNENGQLGMFNIPSLFRGSGSPRPSAGSIEGGLGLPTGFRGAAGRKDTVRADYFSSNNTTAVTSVFTEVGALKVLAQQALRFGFGLPSQSAAASNQGLCYVVLKSPNATTLNGFIRLVAKDANRLNTRVVKEFRTETLGGSLTSKDAQVLLPEQPTSPIEGRNFLVQDEFLALDVKPDTAYSSGVGTELSTTQTSLVISASQYFL